MKVDCVTIICSAPLSKSHPESIGGGGEGGFGGGEEAVTSELEGEADGRRERRGRRTWPVFFRARQGAQVKHHCCCSIRKNPSPDAAAWDGSHQEPREWNRPKHRHCFYLVRCLF